MNFRKEVGNDAIIDQKIHDSAKQYNLTILHYEL